MILRLFCLLFLITAATGTVWYIFRDTPQKKVLRWRELSEVLFEEHGDLAKAEELNKRILELVPHSAYDLAFSGTLKERKGTAKSLSEALAIYDELISRGNSLMGICLYKSRVLRTLGRLREARAVARSVVDAFPYEAHLELGETAMAARSPREAASHFALAVRHAGHPLEAVRARERHADAYWLGIALAKDSMDDARRDAVVQRCLELLRQNYDTLLKLDEDPDTRTEIRLRLAVLAGKLARLGLSGETPYWSTANIIRERVELDERSHREVSAATYASLGQLYLLALHQEIDRLDDHSAREAKVERLRADADTCFLKALGDRSPDEGRTLLFAEDRSDDELLDPRVSRILREQHDYTLNLLNIAKAHLETQDYETLLRDNASGRLALSSRVAAALESPDDRISASFTVLKAFAHLRAGEPDVTMELLDSYMASLPDDIRARAAVDLARQCYRTAPESPLAFRYLDAFAATGAKPLDLASFRLHLLSSMSSSGGVVAEEATKRIETILTAAEKSARTTRERIYVAELLSESKGLSAAVNSLLQSPADVRSEPDLHRAVATLLTERGLELARDGDDEGAVKVYRAALAQYLKLFIRAPSQNDDVPRQAAFLLRIVDHHVPDLSLEPLLPRTIRELDATTRTPFAVALKHFLFGEFDKAIQAGQEIENDTGLQPFWSYALGTCHVQVARNESTLEGVKAGIARAKEAFGRNPEYAPNKAELISLELYGIEGDVSEELLERIESLEKEGYQFEANWLLARALERRFHALYGDRDVKNSVVTKTLHQRQAALREAIRLKPRFTPAYIALADTFVISERLDRELSRQGSPLERGIYSADYERAILLLESAPEPDERVLGLAASYAAAAGRPQDARSYFETLCMVAPSTSVFTGLLANYLATGTGHEVEIVLGAREEIELTPEALEWRDRINEMSRNLPEFAGIRLRSVLGEIRRVNRSGDPMLREALLSALRERLVELPDHRRLANTMLGQIYATRSFSSRLDDQRQAHRRKAIETYNEVVQDYDYTGEEVPLTVLNNLAWILLNGPDATPEDFRRGLVLAERARRAIESPRGQPDVVDTYAWALYQNRRLLEAEAELRTLLAVVESPTYRFHLAQVLAELKRYGEAHDEAERALNSTETFPEEDEARALKYRMREARINALGKTALAQ